MNTRTANHPSVGDELEVQPEGLRETIDSIVIAFILAFVFRAFIIEAFVIPTGSMASTLNGAHGTLICENCGWEYSYGLTDPSAGARGISIDGNAITVCPNCRNANQPTEINDAKRNWESGDRILVLKWPFDIGGDLFGPHRWNVVVFKDPSDGVTNYIKRLTGLPNEVLEIIDGDVYTAPADMLSPEALETLEQMRHVKYLRRPEESTRNYFADPTRLNEMDRDLEDSVKKLLDELNGKLTIQRKSQLAQKDLWRVVHNIDFPPNHINQGGTPKWEADLTADAWTVNQRSLVFDGIDAKQQTVRLNAIIDSTCDYNAIPSLSRKLPSIPAKTPVSDLRVSMVIDYQGGEGGVSTMLLKGNDIFIGKLEANGSVTISRQSLSHIHADPVEVCSAVVAPLKAGQKIEFAFQNLDYRVQMELDRKVVLATDNEQYSPDVAVLRNTPYPRMTTPPAISADHMKVKLSHVLVEKDIYYLSDIRRAGCPWGYKTWGTKNNPIHLRTGEYFMLGDNSDQSKDSRLWDKVGPHLVGRGEDYQVGTVPEDQLIGRAFFVYWPSGLRTSVIPFLKNYGWIPNFGRMRWIR